MFKLLRQIGNEKIVSPLSDPFSKNCVTGVSVHFSIGRWNGAKWSAIGVVYFENGNTKGEQKFSAPTFDECVLQIRAFLETLTQQTRN